MFVHLFHSEFAQTVAVGLEAFDLELLFVHGLLGQQTLVAYLFDRSSHDYYKIKLLVSFRGVTVLYVLVILRL